MQLPSISGSLFHAWSEDGHLHGDEGGGSVPLNIVIYTEYRTNAYCRVLFEGFSNTGLLALMKESLPSSILSVVPPLLIHTFFVSLIVFVLPVSN